MTDGYPYPPQHRGIGPVPGSVKAAIWLMLLRVVVGAVGVVLQLVDRDEIRRKVLERTPNASSTVIDSALTITVAVSIAAIVFYLFLVAKVRAGRNWARIVTWVFAGLGVLSLLISFARPGVGITRALGIVVGLADVAIVVLLAMSRSNEFFRRRNVGRYAAY